MAAETVTAVHGQHTLYRTVGREGRERGEGEEKGRERGRSGGGEGRSGGGEWRSGGGLSNCNTRTHTINYSPC